MTFTRPVAVQYVANVTRPERQSGPWGEALQYWLDRKNWTQADLVRTMQKRERALADPRLRQKQRKVQPNTISRVARGLDTQTSVLKRIADALDVPLTDILVSPARREDRQKLAEAITRRVMQELDAKHRARTIETVATEFARQAEEYDAAAQAALDPHGDADRPPTSHKKR